MAFEPERDVDVSENIARLKTQLGKLERAFDKEAQRWETERKQNKSEIETYERAVQELQAVDEAYDALVEAVKDMDRGLLTLPELLYRLNTLRDL